MRIAFATFIRETNSFCNIRVELEFLRKWTVKGEAKHRGGDGDPILTWAACMMKPVAYILQIRGF